MPRNHNMRLSRLAIITLLKLALTSSGLAAEDSTTHPTKMSIQLRETLCAQQKSTCEASCLGKIQANSCDEETLTWSCACNEDTVKVIQDWQFPIPFKLCRNGLWMCLQECPNTRQSESDEQEKDSKSLEDDHGTLGQQKLQQSREGYHDYDQDDWDAIEELELLKDRSRLETDSYSRFEQEDLKLLSLNKKKKQLHKQLWTRQRNEISRIMAEENGDGGDMVGSQGDLSGNFVVTRNSVAFATYSDPSVHRDKSCVSNCQSQFACGSEFAPQYVGPEMVRNTEA